MRGMGNTEGPRSEVRLTPEERDSRDYARLIQEFGQDPEFMDCLAIAWRLGFHRHMQLGAQSDRMLTINPFWR
jgi:hypothetical protein